MHPSHSANFEKVRDCSIKRDRLFLAIKEACRLIKSDADGADTSEQSRILPIVIPRALSSSTILELALERKSDVDVLTGFLNTVVKLCLPYADSLPPRAIRADSKAPSSYFAFNESQRRELKHHMLCNDEKTQRSLARKTLIPILLRLNHALTRRAYFLQVYHTDWDIVSDVLLNLPESLEELCMHAAQVPKLRQDNDYFSTFELFDHLTTAEVGSDLVRAMGRLERITHRLKRLQPQIRVRTESRFATKAPLNCKCKERIRFDDNELTKAFDRAYVPDHDCSKCY
jgi:hypothetical protein